MSSPYVVGNMLTLEHLDVPGEFQAQIIELYEPFTLSCVMKVKYQQGDLPPIEAVLKLYDRQFAKGLRERRGIGEWDERSEAAYINYARTPQAAELFEKLMNASKQPSINDIVKMPGPRELFMQYECTEFFDSETRAYKTLVDHWCKGVPKLLWTVKLKSCFLPPEDIEETHSSFFDVNGILIDYVPGVTFADMNENNVRHKAWQDVVEQAIEITTIFTKHNMINKDVRCENFIVTVDSAKESGYRTVMIDFGYVVFRKDDETDDDWGRRKFWAKEEGIGRTMQDYLWRRTGFDLKYEPSGQWDKYGPRAAFQFYS